MKINYKGIIETCFQIKDKAGNIVPFKLNNVQGKYYDLLKTDYPSFTGIRENVLKARKEGFCLDPKTRVLTANLRWIPIGELEKSQEVVAVDEPTPISRGKGRKMCTAIVEKKRFVKEEAFLLKMEDGRELIATANHRFLITTRNSKKPMWRSVKDKRLRSSLVGCKIRYVTKPWGKRTLEDAWFGGFLDGDGSIRAKKSGGAEVMGCQRKGVVWNRMIKYANNTGFSYREEWDNRGYEGGFYKGKFRKNPLGRIVFNRMNELFELIGRTRPTRFISKNWWVGKDLPGKRSGKAWSRVTKIEPLGVRRMVDIQTSTGTFIAEGFVSHNSSLIAAIFTVDFILSGLKKIPVISSQVIAHREPDVKPHFNRINLFLESFLNKYKIPRKSFLVVDNQTSYIKNISGAEFSVGMAGSRAMGRGGDTLNLHWTEVGFYPNNPIMNAEDLVIGSEKQVPLELGKIFRESTGNVVGDFWNEEFERGLSGKSNFKSRFFPWFEFYEYQVNCPPAFKGFSAYEKEIRKTYNLTNNQLYWYHLESKSISDSNKFRREHPCNIQEAFLSGGSCFFDIATLNWYLKHTKEPLEEGLLAPSGVFI